MKRQLCLRLTMFLTLIFLSGSLAGATFYVSKTDSGIQGAAATDGTEKRPFSTIANAVALAKAGDVILITPGVYAEPLKPKFSGTKESPIVFQATKRHGVVVTGAMALLESEANVSFITVRGIVFRDTRRDIWKINGQAHSGWKIEDCVFEGGGLDARISEDGKMRAENVTFLRVICQQTWGCGMCGQGVNGFLIKDCVIRRCNRSGERVADCTGGSKVFNTDGCRVENLVSYDNVGAGWWFDFNNTHFEISGGTFFGNHGVNAENQAGGIWLEKNSHGRVWNNLVYSNHGSGISIWSMEDLIVEDNTFVDNLTTWWRAQGLDDKGGERLWNITMRNNRIKSWRRDAHSISAWEIVNIKNVVIDGNVYDPPTTEAGGKPLWFWWGKDGKRLDTFSLEETREKLGFETHGSLSKIPFDRPLFATKAGLEVQLGKDGEQYSIDETLEKAGAKIGDVVDIPVQGRLDIQKSPEGKWFTEVYDLARKRHVRTTIESDEIKSAIDSEISRFAMWTPVWLKVRLSRLDEYDIQGVAAGAPHAAHTVP